MPPRPSIPAQFTQYMFSAILDWTSQYGLSLLRILRIHPLAQILRRYRRKYEPPKVALYNDRRIAILSIFLHIIPLTSAVVLVTLNLQTIDFGSVSTSMTTAIQFVAKWLEILIQSSIAAMLLDVVRHKIPGKSSLPLGVFIAPYRLTDLSYLWSLEYWGSLRAANLSKLYRALLCLGLMLAVVLASVVGPATAVAIVPRNLELSVWKESAFFEPRMELFPEKVDLVSGSLRHVCNLIRGPS